MKKTLTMILGALALLLASNAYSAEGEPAPDFTLKTLDGTNLKLSEQRGTVILLNFWASWCGPCRKSLPALDALQKEIGSQQFEVVAVNLDVTRQEALEFLKQYPVSYTVLRDGSGGISRKYDLVGLPSSVLIDRTGIIVSSFQGFHPSHIEKLRKALPYLLE